MILEYRTNNIVSAYPGLSIGMSIPKFFCTIISQALDHVKEKIVGLSTSSSLDLLNYPELDQLISDKVDRMAVCQLFHWAAVKHSHQDGLRAKPMQKVGGCHHFHNLLCINCPLC